MNLIEKVLQERDNFDLIHFHIDYLHFPSSRTNSCLKSLHCTDGWTFRTSCLSTVSSPRCQLFRSPTPNALLCLGSTGRERFTTVCRKTVSVLYLEGREYLAFLGRVSPEKGLDQAIEIAKQAGMPLKIAAKIDRADHEYFETCIKPLMNTV